MNIIICGAGRVGFSISKQLSAQGHSITVIDQSSEFIQKMISPICRARHSGDRLANGRRAARIVASEGSAAVRAARSLAPAPPAIR